MYIPRQSGAVGGVKEAWKNRLGWGGKNMRDARERREARIAGYWSSGEGSRADRANRAQNEFVNKKAREIAEENKKNQVSDEKIRKDLKAAADGKDKNDPWVQARGRAAIASMNDREIMNVNDLEGALKVAGNDMDLVASIVRKAPKEMIASSANLSKALESISKSIDTTVNQMTNKTEEQRKAERTRLKEKMLGSLVEKSSGGALGGSADEIKTIMTSFTDNGQVNEELLRALKGKMKKEGQMNAMINYEMEHGTNKVAANATAEEKQKAFEKIFRELKMHEYTGKSLGEQKGLVDQEQFRRHFIEGYRNKEYNATDRQDLHRAGSGAHRGELERELSAIDEERERRRGEDESRRRQNERDREIEERNRRRNGTA